MSDLPVLLSPDGEAVELLTAQDLLRSRGIEDVQAAETTDTVRVMDEIQHVQSLLNEAKSMLSDELVSRLDKRGKWTLEVEGLKVTAPSPDAGTVSYDPDKLDLALGELWHDDVIDEPAIHAAIERVTPPSYWKVKQAGVKALLKLPKAREAIEACRVETTPAPRKARVTRS